MPTYTFYIVRNDFLAFNGGTGAFDLSAAYTPQTGRYRIEVTDDDSIMNSGGDANQIATVYDLQGNVIASGPIAVPAYAEVQAPGGGSLFLDRVEVNGVHYGYLPSAPLSPGASYPVLMSSTFEEPHTYYQTNSVPCFGPGAMIATPRGPIPAGALEPGDLVLTRDHGYRPLRWVGRALVRAEEQAANPGLCPARIAPGLFGATAPLLLSGNHRVLLKGASVQLHFAAGEVLAAAKHLARLPGVTFLPPRTAVGYTHLLLDEHEVLCANGVWVESLLDAPGTRDALPMALRRQVERLTGPGAMQAARMCLSCAETALLTTRPSTASRAGTLAA